MHFHSLKQTIKNQLNAGRVNSFTSIEDVKNVRARSETFEGTEGDKANDIELANNGGYIIAGTTTSSFGVLGADAWLVKIDTDGNHQRNRIFEQETRASVHCNAT